MVELQQINKVLDDILVKHGAMWYNLQDTLKEITDNRSEYLTVRDDAYQFRKETKNLEHEELIIKGTNGTFFRNKEGDEHCVGRTNEMEEFIDKCKESLDNEQVLYSCHNHPDVTCFQSKGDIGALINDGAKYGISTGNDGMMIIKNNNPSDSSGERALKGRLEFEKLASLIQEEFTKEYANRIESLKEEYNINGGQYYQEDLDDFNEELGNLFRKYVNRDIESYTKKLDDYLSKVGLRAYYVPNSTRLSQEEWESMMNE